MMKYFLILPFLFSALFVGAHQADLSSTILSETKDGNWVIQVRAALTAFEYEIDFKYGKDAYDSPQIFEQLVIDHLTNNISISVDNGEKIVLQKGRVALGHETNVVFLLEGFPKNFKEIIIGNSSFKNINRNQSALVFLKNGFEKQQFVLNNDNEHIVTLEKNGAHFKLKNKQVSYLLKNKYLVLGMCTVLFFIGAVVLIRSKKANSKD